MDFEFGETVEREVHFAGGAAIFVAANAFEEIAGQIAGLHKFFERQMRIDAGGDDGGGDFFAGFQDDAGCAAVLDEDSVDRRLRADFDAGFAGRCADGVRNGAGAAAAESPGAEGAVDFAHVVMQKNVGGAGRADAEECADDAGCGHRGFERIGLEPLIEEIGGAHGHELDERVALVGRKAAETLQHEVKLLEVARVERGRIGRDHRQHRLHEATHRRHHLREFVVGFGVEAGVAANFALGARVVVHAPEIVAVEHRRERAVERKNFEAMARKVEFANDFRAKKRNNVGALGEKEAGDDFFGDGGAAKNVAAFQRENFLARFGEIRGVDQAVVAAADHDYVIVLRHSLDSSAINPHMLGEKRCGWKTA